MSAWTDWVAEYMSGTEDWERHVFVNAALDCIEQQAFGRSSGPHEACQPESPVPGGHWP